MIIVLCGVAGSGKDTVADILVRDHGFIKESFAKPMKEMVKLAYPAFTDEDLYGPSKNRSNQYKQYPLSSCPWCGGAIYQALDGGRCYSEPEHAELPEFLSPRLVLQVLGTEFGRRLYINTWIDACFARIHAATELYKALEQIAEELPNYVITDGRFLNEVQRSNELGAITVRLSRGAETSTVTHSSETEFVSIPKNEFRLWFDNQHMKLEELPTEVKTLYETVSNLKRIK